MAGKKSSEWTNPIANRYRYNKEYSKKRRVIRRDLLWTWKGEEGCLICGEKDPRCLDYHHRDGSHKLMCISRMSGYNLEKVQEEIGKCDVLCANCHRKLHK